MNRLAQVALWLSLGVLVAWAVYAMSSPVYLHACSKTTCKAGAGLADSDLLAREVRVVSDSAECPEKCSNVHYGSGQAHVMGHWLDLACRAWGGSPCMWDRVTHSKKMIEGITERRYGE